MKDGLVRADALPLVFKALGCETLPRGTQVRVRITGTDALTLDVHANLLARLDETPAEAPRKKRTMTPSTPRRWRWRSTSTSRAPRHCDVNAR